MSDMTPQDKRTWRKLEFQRKFARFWLIYIALMGTAVLSGISGMLLPIAENQQNFFDVITLATGLFYAIGFLSNGEGAAYFWFDKLTDHDEDNGWQVFVAVTMLVISVLTILMTTLAAGSFIAFFVGALTEFQVVPTWAQKWIVWAIPSLWVINFTAGTAFKALSDEAASERKSNAKIRQITQKIQSDKADARARYWEEHAPDLAQQLGAAEAEAEIKRYKSVLGKRNPT